MDTSFEAEVYRRQESRHAEQARVIAEFAKNMDTYALPPFCWKVYRVIHEGDMLVGITEVHKTRKGDDILALYDSGNISETINEWGPSAIMPAPIICMNGKTYNCSIDNFF